MAFSQTLDLAPAIGGRQRQLSIAVAGGPHAPERARAWLRHARAWLGEDNERALELLLSELVNNAVRHGGACDGELIELELRAVEGGVAVRVSDPGPGFAPMERDKGIDEPGGWGLVLVDQMSERWGVVHDGRTHVWFELRCALA